MGAAVGQVPEYTEMITSWQKKPRKLVISKLTPNVTDISHIALAANAAARCSQPDQPINSLMAWTWKHCAGANVAGKVFAWRLLRPSCEAPLRCICL